MYVYKGSDQSWAGFEISRVHDTARAVSSARQKKKKEKKQCLVEKSQLADEESKFPNACVTSLPFTTKVV